MDNEEKDIRIKLGKLITDIRMDGIGKTIENMDTVEKEISMAKGLYKDVLHRGFDQSSLGGSEITKSLELACYFYTGKTPVYDFEEKYGILYRSGVNEPKVKEVNDDTYMTIGIEVDDMEDDEITEKKSLKL